MRKARRTLTNLLKTKRFAFFLFATKKKWKFILELQIFMCFTLLLHFFFFIHFPFRNPPPNPILSTHEPPEFLLLYAFIYILCILKCFVMILSNTSIYRNMRRCVFIVGTLLFTSNSRFLASSYFSPPMYAEQCEAIFVQLLSLYIRLTLVHLH